MRVVLLVVALLGASSVVRKYGRQTGVILTDHRTSFAGSPGTALGENGNQTGEFEAPDPSALPEPGMYKTGPMSPDGLDTFNMELVIREDMAVQANVQGSVDGKNFALALRGHAERDGTIKAGSAHGSSHIYIEATYADEAVRGVAHGQAAERAPYRFQFEAQPVP